MWVSSRLRVLGDAISITSSGPQAVVGQLQEVVVGELHAGGGRLHAVAPGHALIVAAELHETCRTRIRTKLPGAVNQAVSDRRKCPCSRRAASQKNPRVDLRADVYRSCYPRDGRAATMATNIVTCPPTVHTNA